MRVDAPPTPATYYNGRSTQAFEAWILVHGHNLVVLDRQRQTLDRQPLGKIRVQPALHNVPQRIDLGNGATLVVADKDRLAWLLSGAGIEPGFVERAQASWFTVGCALVALIALVWILYQGLLPWAASMAARWLPSSLESRFVSDLWPQMDQRMFQPSRIPEAQQIDIRGRFAQLTQKLPDAPDYHIEFRAWNGGANAYALPGGLIVVTDDLVARAGRGPALMGVLAHELGHVAYRHAFRTVLQGAAVSGVFVLFLGDVSNLAAPIPAALLNQKYSRDFERAADDYAIDLLAAGGLSPAPLADLLQSLDQESDEGTNASRFARFLASHPSTSERVARLREAARRFDERTARPGPAPAGLSASPAGR